MSLKNVSSGLISYKPTPASKKKNKEQHPVFGKTHTTDNKLLCQILNPHKCFNMFPP